MKNEVNLLDIMFIIVTLDVATAAAAVAAY